MTKKEKQHRVKLLYICDWLPPDHGAVGQYSELFARQLALAGADVVLGGLSSTGASKELEQFSNGSLEIIKFRTKRYEKQRFAKRLLWTFKTNTRLLSGLWKRIRWADEILFTGSPPLFLHWIAPLNIFLGKRLIYRITDFHPECLMAARDKPSMWLNALHRLTVFWRRRIDMFEILGEDQRARLEEIGIPATRIRLKRDPSPVDIPPETSALPRPEEYTDKYLLLYSGNWGVAHDYETFIEAYRLHHQQGSGRIVLWLNAMGAAAGKVADGIGRHDLPLIRSQLVPLEDLASLLVTPDAHLITLLDPFVGFVMPSKVYGCIQSGKPVFYIGSERSDVHLLCSEKMKNGYYHVNTGEVEACAAALEKLADGIASQTKKSPANNAGDQ